MICCGAAYRRLRVEGAADGGGNWGKQGGQR